MLDEKRPQSASLAAGWLLAHSSALFLNRHGEPLTEFTLRRKLPGLIGEGQKEGGFQIDFEQQDAP